jgi:hypothetical protein
MGLKPPVLEVGFNYPWVLNRYGSTIGPRDYDQNQPPTGANDATPSWDPSLGGALDTNLKFLRDVLKITKVRMFVLGNAINYGATPVLSPTPSGKSFFTAPAQAHPLFVSHFTQMLQLFQENGMEILPSLLDFGAFYPMVPGSGGGRTSILTSQRQVFLSTMVQPLIQASIPYRSTIFAWEVINEPIWNLNLTATSRPHTPTQGPDCDMTVMASFIQDCCSVIEGNGFQSTVGHRYFSDLTGGMGTGTYPQFHYYGQPLTSYVTSADPNPIPPYAGAFVGEIGAGPGGLLPTGWPGGAKNEAGFPEPGGPWSECQGSDKDRVNTCYARLAVLARKGYKLAFVWPDRDSAELGVATKDELKLSNDAQTSIRRFTTGTFPNGIP